LEKIKLAGFGNILELKLMVVLTADTKMEVRKNVAGTVYITRSQVV
jgi:hypothetical protein